MIIKNITSGANENNINKYVYIYLSNHQNIISKRLIISNPKNNIRVNNNLHVNFGFKIFPVITLRITKIFWINKNTNNTL
jgi:hypothetical protein